MRISVSDAEQRLDELVLRAESGEDIILTIGGKDAARLAPMTRPRAPLDPAARRAILEENRRSAAAEATPGPSAARSQDILYDENGLPK